MILRLAERDGPSETVPSALHERIAARAYGLYIARGAAEGNDQEDWLRAEAEILAREGGPADDDAQRF
jgi:hypothetical protein